MEGMKSSSLGERVIEVDVGELWHNTYTSPDKGNLGSLHLETVRMLLRNPETPAVELPLYGYIMSLKYRALPGGSRSGGHEGCVAYLEQYRQVFKSIEAKGYVQQPKLDPTNPTSKFGLIPVRIMPNGTIRLKDGARRLTTILVLGKQRKIPVEVVERAQPNLHKIEEIILKLAGGKRFTYHPLNDPSSALYHPYFKDWGVGRPDTPFRLRAILPKLSEVRTILCIGPCEGYFSTNLAARGYDVTAVEFHPERAKVLKFFANLRGLNYPVVVDDWRSYCARTERGFDAILFLTTFHHQLISDGLGEFKKLGLLRAKKLFFEMATNRDPRMGEFPALNSEEIVRKVLENTRFTKWKKIYVSPHAIRTGIFMFW